jgi:Antitoxin ParD
MSRLTIDLSDKQHQSLKAIAALQGKTIRQYALEKLFDAEGAPWTRDEQQAWDAFMAEMERRGEEAVAGHVSKRTAEEILAAVLAEKQAA